MVIHDCIHIYTYIHIYVCIYIHIYLYVYAYIHKHTHAQTRKHTYAHTHTNARTHTHAHTHTYVYIYMCVYIYIHVRAYPRAGGRRDARGQGSTPAYIPAFRLHNLRICHVSVCMCVYACVCVRVGVYLCLLERTLRHITQPTIMISVHVSDSIAIYQSFYAMIVIAYAHFNQPLIPLFFPPAVDRGYSQMLQSDLFLSLSFVRTYE